MSPKRTQDRAGDGEAVLETCLGKFDESVARVARAALERVRALAPGATELVYDAYNALSVPFATGEKLGDAFVSVVVYPKHVNLAFLWGAELEDPEGLLQGSGARIRHVRLEPGVLEDVRVARLVRAAAKLAGHAGRRGALGEVVVKKIYARQRPRRPRGSR